MLCYEELGSMWASIRISERSPVHCKNLTHGTSISPSQAENKMLSGIDTKSDTCLHDSSAVVTVENAKDDAAKPLPTLAPRAQKITTTPESPETSGQTFLPAWRRKSKEKIQRLKIQREGISLSYTSQIGIKYFIVVPDTTYMSA